MSTGDKEFTKILKQAELKVTSGRLLILSVLDEHHKPVSVMELRKLLKNRIDQATIYRNLLNLETAGLVRRIDKKDDKAYFELADEHDHHHIICTKCGLIEDFYGCNITSVERQVLKKSKQFSIVKEHSMELFGICKSCDKN
jgi:Fur family ferric uptake transcriptional regulator